MAGSLPRVPFHDLGPLGADELARREWRRAGALLEAGRRDYGGAFLGAADRLSRRWLRRTRNPYAGEIDTVAAVVGAPGTHFLNLSHEWGCTTGVAPDPEGEGMRILRTLDWPLPGLGQGVVAVRREGPAGDWLEATWPGFAGTLTAMAPGRFALAMNQAPMMRRGLPLALDWGLNRIAMLRSRALPPVHLARQACESATGYAAARRLLAGAPLCMPALFVLAGAGAGEGCVIERTEEGAAVHEAPACIANHWLSPHFPGRERETNSRGRHAAFLGVYETAADDPGFAWLVPPVLNPTTRLVAIMNPAAGILRLRGFEADGPATAVFDSREAR